MTDRQYIIGEFSPASDDDLIICRCEEITKGEIRRAVFDGMFNICEVRRLLRCGMGLCQGLTCGRLVKSVIAGEIGLSATALEDATARAPMRPTEMFIFAKEVTDE
ncbi:MAG: (2Fe-2S)-binding protein [Defluviitaleaceae bacterium]|nr:(2Fe-2S)-binding protein [Defluviitaleaceae bacterium]